MNTLTSQVCYHCSEPLSDNKVLFSEYSFCCNGCVTVYKILSNSELCQYYDISAHPGIRLNDPIRINKYDFLDSEEQRKKIVKFSDRINTHILLNIPQIHCTSCLWLLERLYKLDENIQSSQVYYEKKEVYIVFNESNLNIKKLIGILSAIGYEPSFKQELEIENSVYSQRENILKIGIAGFCFANIMMLCLPEYFASGIIHAIAFSKAIPFILIGLSIPILYIAYTDFIQTAYKGLKKGIFNIDLPVSIAIIITFIRSLYEISYHLSNGYLDSMSGIVFFMLLGRWLQNRTQNYLNFDRNHLSYFPISVERLRNDRIEMVPIQEIKAYDHIKIYSKEIIPMDCILSKGEGLIDYSFVNGESTPISIAKGEHIYAGGRQLSGSIELIAMKQHSQSQLTALWNHEEFKKTKEDSGEKWTDKLGVYFTYIVIGLSFIAGIYWFMSGDYYKMWNAISTVLIVACPCALLLSSSFTYGQVTRVLSQHKFFIKSHTILEKIMATTHIVFDKTGTLTHAEKNNVSYEGIALSANEKTWVSSLLSHSNHPLSKSIYNYLGAEQIYDSINFKESTGQGIEGWIDEKYIKMGSDKFCTIDMNDNRTHVNVIIDGEIKGAFFITNVYRLGINDLMQKLQNKFAISILSGDGDSEYNLLRKIIFPEHKISFNQTPIQKLEYIKNLRDTNSNVLMIGDGLNDSGAFQASNVAIALTEKNNFFNPASDIIMDSESLPKLNSLIEFIKKANSIIKWMFIYSLLYNIIGLYFALRGELSPVIAAILMPISSISIILFIHLLTEYYHSKYLKT